MFSMTNDESTPTLTETPIAKRTVSQKLAAAQRPTIPAPPSAPVNQFANLPCGVPGYNCSARAYALQIVAAAREGNFGWAEQLIKQAREANMLGVIRAAYTGTI